MTIHSLVSLRIL